MGADGGGAPLAGSAVRTVDLSYDLLGRVTDRETTLSDGAGTDSIASRTWDFDSYGTPRRVQSEDNGVVVVDETRVTDGRGRLTHSALVIEGSAYGTAVYGYRANGQVSAQGYHWTDGTSRTVSYGRDVDGLVTTVTDSAAGLLAEVEARDARGRVTALTLRSGAEVSLSWDALGRPESMELVLGSGAPQSRSTTYDARGRLQSRTVNGQMTAYGYAEPGWLTEELSHDSAGLLTSQQVYDYDDAGNRTSHESFDGSGVLESARFFTYGTGNRLLSVDGAALTWDELGGVTEDAQGYRIDRFPDGRAAMVGTPADPSGLLDVLGEPVTLPGSSVALEVVRAADGLPARLYDGSPTPHTRVWGKEEGPWPLSGDSEGVW